MTAASFSFCNVSVMPVRSEPAHRAEQVTQLLFGEKAEILETNAKDWARICIAYDGYTGWCKQSQLTVMTRKDFRKPVKYVSANHAGRLIFDNGAIMLPLGGELTGLKNGRIAVAGQESFFKGKKVNLANNELSAASVLSIADM